MDVPSSQQAGAAQGDRRKAGDGASVIAEQHRAAEEAGAHRARSFRYEDAYVENVAGEKVFVKLWVSDQSPAGIRKKASETFRCGVCDKEFDKKQKMLLHARFHKKEPAE